MDTGCGGLDYNYRVHGNIQLECVAPSVGCPDPSGAGLIPAVDQTSLVVSDIQDTGS